MINDGSCVRKVFIDPVWSNKIKRIAYIFYIQAAIGIVTTITNAYIQSYLNQLRNEMYYGDILTFFAELSLILAIAGVISAIIYVFLGLFLKDVKDAFDDNLYSTAGIIYMIGGLFIGIGSIIVAATLVPVMEQLLHNSISLESLAGLFIGLLIMVAAGFIIFIALIIFLILLYRLYSRHEIKMAFIAFILIIASIPLSLIISVVLSGDEYTFIRHIISGAIGVVQNLLIGMSYHAVAMQFTPFVFFGDTSYYLSKLYEESLQSPTDLKEFCKRENIPYPVFRKVLEKAIKENQIKGYIVNDKFYAMK